MASHLAAVEQAQGRLFGAAALGGVRAALVESAAGRWVQRVGQFADDLDFRLVRVRVNGRGGRQQRLGVRVQRTLIDVVLRAHFHRATEVHHHHVIGHVLDDRQVVGDEHVGGVELLLQVHEQVEHLRLDRHVQCRGRFVRHQHFRLQHHGARQGDPLALTAGEHVRITLVVLRTQAHLLHHRLDFLATFGGRQVGVDQQRLAELVTDLLSWVQRGVRALEHHLHVFTQLLALSLVSAGHFLPGDFQGTGGRLFDQCQGTGQSGFAATRFAYNGEGLAGFQFERHTVKRANQRMALEQAAGHFVMTLLCEGILRGAPQVHILATSRESLRAEGEYVQRLESLDCPPPIAVLDRAQTLSFSALQLFVERAMANHDSFELSDEELPLAIEICQRLDGIPLAIELAAAQVADLGIDGLLTQLQGSFRLLTQGSQTTLGRHQTLRATLDWSFELLSVCEQTCLRRLGLFRGGFTLESAAAVIVGEHIEPNLVLASITQLVAKSLLNVEVGDEEVFYRLLDTTRSYALEKLHLAAEVSDTRQRHAERCLALMQQAQDDWEQTPTHLWIERYARGLEDIRAALEWGLHANGPQMLAIRLTASSMPLWQELSLLKEHGVYVRRALALLDAAAEPCPRLTIALKLALGSSCYHAQGGTAETVDAFVSARTLAERYDDVAGQLRAVSGHMAVNLCSGNYQMALEQSQQFDRLGLHGDAVLSLSTHRLRVLALHFSGDQQQAREHAEQVIQRMAQSGHLNRFTHGFGVQYDQSVAALTILARILWLQGQPEQAWRTARQALDIAIQINHGTSICYTLALSGCLIAHYNGDTATARELLRMLLEQAQKHSVVLFYNWARQYAQVIEGAEGPSLAGVGLVKEIMVTLDGGFVDGALLARAESGAAGWSTAEILRVRGEALVAEELLSGVGCLGGRLRAQAGSHRGEAVLLEALAVAKSQGALAWELRSATSLAQLWQRQGHAQQAYELLAPIYGRFTEGFATPDLTKVRRLLDELAGQLHA